MLRSFVNILKNVTSDEKENLINGDFATTSINQKWYTDITYIHTLKDGWTYLASVMDLHSKKIIGYAYDLAMTADLAVRAVDSFCFK